MREALEKKLDSITLLQSYLLNEIYAFKSFRKTVLGKKSFSVFVVTKISNSLIILKRIKVLYKIISLNDNNDDNDIIFFRYFYKFLKLIESSKCLIEFSVSFIQSETNHFVIIM